MSMEIGRYIVFQTSTEKYICNTCCQGLVGYTSDRIASEQRPVKHPAELYTGSSVQLLCSLLGSAARSNINGGVLVFLVIDQT